MTKRKGVGVLSAVVYFILGVISTVIVTHLYYKKSESITYKTTHAAVQRKIPQIKKLPATLKVGSDILIIATPNQPIKLPSRSPYTLEVDKDGNLLLNGQIKDRQGNVVAYIENSYIYTSPGLNYDVNSDSDAIEIVDEQLNIVFQILKMPSNGSESILLRYASYSFSRDKSNPMMEIADDKGIRFTDNLSSADRMKGVERLFEYPGYEKPGLRKK